MKHMSEEKLEQFEFVEFTIKNLLERLGISYNLERQDLNQQTWFSIATSDPVFNFGEISKNISALNTILRRIFEKKFGDAASKFLIDINDFQKKHTEEIKDTARMHAQRVRYFKKEIEMPAMNAYERRLVHTVLQEYPDIATESRGEGFERRVVVKPVSLG